MHRCKKCGFAGSRKKVRKHIKEYHAIKGNKPYYDKKDTHSPITEMIELI